MYPQVMDDLHIDNTSQSLLNPALRSRALSLPTPMKKPLHPPLGHHHFFSSQSHTLRERGAGCVCAGSPPRSPSCPAVLGLDRSVWRERHWGLLWGTESGAGLRQA